MKKLFYATGIFLFVFLMLGTFETDQVNAESWRFAHIAQSPEEVQNRFAEEFANRVKDEIGKEVKIYPAGQLGGLAEQLEGVSIGNIQFAINNFGDFSRYVEDIAVFDAPYIYEDGEHALKSVNPEKSPLMRDFNKELVEKANVRILGAIYRGSRNLTTSDFPVYSPEDLSGKKIRGVPIEIWTVMIEGMGATPVSIDWSEVQTALMTGVVDGQENPIRTVYDFELWEVQDYVQMTGHMQAIEPVYVNENTWQSLSNEEKEIIRDIVSELSLKTLEWARKDREEIIKKLQDNEKITVITRDEIDIEAFRRSVLDRVNEEFPEWEKYIDEIEKLK
jgi:tripartite ATP-independent transporter DctP family solute receptor